MKFNQSIPGFSISLKTLLLPLAALALFSIPLLASLGDHEPPPKANVEANSSIIDNGSICGQITDAITGESLIGVNILIESLQLGNLTDFDGGFCLKQLPAGKHILKVTYIGYQEQTHQFSLKAGEQIKFDLALKPSTSELSEVIIIDGSRVPPPPPPPMEITVDDLDIELEEEMVFYDHVQIESKHIQNIPGVVSGKSKIGRKKKDRTLGFAGNTSQGIVADKSYGGLDYRSQEEPSNTEAYDFIKENEFKGVIGNPLSTFSIDVDAASYANVRRHINSSVAPPADAVRIEELVNYFQYDYPEPQKDIPFSVVTEISETPWNDTTRLIHIGLEGLDIDYSEASPSNLVFLIDVSGSMSATNKLPLVQQSLNMLVNQLEAKDRIALVVYAGSAGAVLPSTAAGRKDVIKSAINRLKSGGSTAGGAGIKLAYDIAERNLIEGGNNRVILCTDGDFNVGASSNSEMTRLIEEKRKTGISITVCGFGMGNYKDSKMEKIADHGNGNYYYIDSRAEAEKVFVDEMRATLFTIAKDVKLQIEFNPTKVKSYRLIGYENRLLAKEDFDDDTKDAGELGAGHTVTALYEVVLNRDGDRLEKDNGKSTELRYQQTQVSKEAYSNEVLTLKFRFKKPDGDVSRLIEQTLVDKSVPLSKSSDNFRWSAAVAEWGMLLRDSEFKGNSSFAQVLDLAKGAKGTDPNGYRSEFIELVQQSSGITASK